MSAATVSRLPSYLRALVDAATAGSATISSDTLAVESGTQPATVRRDLGSLSITGTRGVGYDVKELVAQISAVLGVDQTWPVVIVGVGNLGRALANYGTLADRGFPVRALVDTDSALIGQRIDGVIISPSAELPELIEQHHIAVGVIATPASVAQDVADVLTACGVNSLLNFAAASVLVPPGVEVRSVDLATELQILSFYRQRSAASGSGIGVPLPAPVHPPRIGS